jgi:hypothetical protein
MYKEWEMVWEDCMGQRQLRENGRSAVVLAGPLEYDTRYSRRRGNLEERFERMENHRGLWVRMNS